MEKRRARALLDSIGGHRQGSLIKTGYVTKAGTDVTVEGRIVELLGRGEDITGVRIRIAGVWGGDIARRDDNTAALSLDRIAQGEAMRMRRRIVVDPRSGQPRRRATGKQVRYATDLYVEAALMKDLQMPDDEIAALAEEAREHFSKMSSEEISLRIQELRGEL